jgi:hypothetical protein
MAESPDSQVEAAAAQAADASAQAVLRCLAVLTATAAIIHFAVAGSHFQEYWAFGVFMLVAAWLQLAWAVLAVVRPRRALLTSGIVLQAAVIAVYVVTRSYGVVVGPTPREVEPVGFGDLLCTSLEAVSLAGCAWLLAGRAAARRPVRGVGLVLAPVGTGAAAAVLLSIALVAGGPEMVMNMADDSSSPGAMRMSGSPASSLSLPTGTPGGDITMPASDMQMSAGMRMADSAPCVATPTAAQQQAAVALVRDSWAGARKYQSLDAAKAAGYRPITPSGRPVVHYLDPAAYRRTERGGPPLDTAEPQSLVYANTPKGAVLVAAMYIAAPGEPTPRPGGCLTLWHIHTDLCLDKKLGVVGTTETGCPAGSVNRVTPPMMHIWFAPIPGGPTAVDAFDEQVVRAAEQVPSPANGPA